MDLFEAIRTRRSVRAFTDEPVSEEQLERLFRAAMAAANSGNQQPWRFIVVDDPAIGSAHSTSSAGRTTSPPS